MVRGKIIKSKVLMRVWACLMACLVLVCSVPVRVSAASASTTMPSMESYKVREFTLPSDTNVFRFTLNTEGVVLDDGTFVSYVGDTAVIEIDSHFGSFSSYADNSWEYDHLSLYTWFSSSFDLTYTDYSNGLATINQTCTKVMPYVIVSGEKKYISNNNSNSFVISQTMLEHGFSYGIEVQLVINYSGAGFSDSSIIGSLGVSTLELTVNPSSFVLYGVRVISTGDNAIVNAIHGLGGSVEVQIEKSEAEIALQEQQNQLQQEQNDKLDEQINNQEELIEQEKEGNATKKKLLEKITDFFDNFFDRLGDFLLHIIVPSAEELTAFLDEVNEWFGERLGFLWFPFSFAIEVVQVLADGEADSNFRVPGFSLNIQGTQYQIWNELSVDMDAFGIFRYVRFFTSALLVSGVVKLAVSKWDAWIGGRSAS